MSTSPAGLARALTEASGARTSESPPDRLAYSRDLWPRHHLAVRDGRIATTRPAAIVWPESPEQVAQIAAWCGERGVPLVPFGAGSGVCGGILPSAETVVLDLKKLRRWRVDRERGVLEADAGVLGIRLEEELEPLGYTVGHFPSSILCSTVGGWVAARGAGQCSGRYGKIEDMVVSLACVDGRGETATLRRRLCGPDLTPLWIGSEGVLGVVTKAELRLHPLPERRGFLALAFATMEAGHEAIRQLYQAGQRPAVTRLYDPFDSMMARRGAARQARKAARLGRAAKASPAAALKKLVPGLGAIALRQALRVPGAINAIVNGAGDRLFGGAMLVLIFEGGASEVEAGLEAARKVGAKLGAEDLGQAPARHWLEHRYSVSYRQAPMLMAGAFVDTMEVAAPWSKLDGLYRSVRAALGGHAFVMAHMSHAYPDGCSIYFTFAGSGADDTACEREYDRAWQDALDAAIGAGGTLSHHHGVGRSKAPKLAAEIGAGVDLIGALRKAIDPRGIFNPGNLEPREGPSRAATLSPAPERPRLDERDRLVHASGTATLAEVEAVLAERGLSLDLGQGAARSSTVADWLAAGAAGAPNPWLDPVDHLVAGFTAELHAPGPRGASLAIHPCPRRAAGPDLYALFHGTNGRIGHIQSAWLRARDPDHRAPTLPIAFDPEPPIDAPEQTFIDRVLMAKP